MQTGKKAKRKAATAALHVHEEYASARVSSTSTDARRVHLTTSTFGSSSADTQPEAASEDLQALRAFDDVENFTYLLGDDLPFQAEDDAGDEAGSDGIRVTLKAKRHDRSVSRVEYYCIEDAKQIYFLFTQDFPLSAWIPFRDEYLDEMLRLEGRGGQRFHERCFMCLESGPEFRCMDHECSGGGMMCKRCILATHKRLPLHWIEVRAIILFSLTLV